MSVAAWSVVWQVVTAGACLLFFGLAAYVTLGAIRDARALFHDLRESRDGD
jgi:hypothetical protein